MRSIYKKKVLNQKFSTNESKVKSLVHLFKGGRGQGGGATLSLSSDSEIRLLTAKVIKVIADKLKSSKAACTENLKTR